MKALPLLTRDCDEVLVSLFDSESNEQQPKHRVFYTVAADVYWDFFLAPFSDPGRRSLTA